MDRVWIIVIGGLLPAIGFGLAAVFQKGASLQGMQVGTYLVYAGLVVTVAGLIMRAIFGETDWALSGAALAVMGGLGLALGNGALAFAITRLGAPIALITPINVLGTLITVLTGFIVFQEHLEVAAMRLVLGTVLVVGGAALVATS